MAGMPAYRYDRASAQPSRQPEYSPSVHVVPGRKHVANPTLSDGAILGIKILVAVLVAFLIFGIARVALSTAAYSVASEASTLRSQISDARTTGEALAVQESLLSSPSNIRSQAESRLQMGSATASSTIELSVDPVAIDSAGNLSFAESMSRLSAQG